MRKKLRSNTTKEQLEMKVGDMVEVTLDDGSKVEDVCRNVPTIICGTWCAWLEKRGCYMLARCRILKEGG